MFVSSAWNPRIWLHARRVLVRLFSIKVQTPKPKPLVYAFSVLPEEIRENVTDYACLLKRCGDLNLLAEGRFVHAHILSHGLEQQKNLSNLIIEMYGQCGALADAQVLFDRLPWWNKRSGSFMVEACVQQKGVEDARKLFDRMPERDIFTWNAMIAAYAHRFQLKDCLDMLQQMQVQAVRPDKSTFSCIIESCSNGKFVAEGKEVHLLIVQYNLEPDFADALIDMYVKCHRIEDAEEIFNKTVKPNAASYNALVAGYAQVGQNKKALQLFRQMQLNSLTLDKDILLVIIKVCADIGSLDEAMRIYARIVSKGLETDVVVGNALIIMFSKCKSLGNAQKAFDKISMKNVDSWASIIAVHIQLGVYNDALQLFHHMWLQNLLPDKDTIQRILDIMDFQDCFAEGKLIHSYVLYKRLGFDVGFEEELVIRIYGRL